MRKQGYIMQFIFLIILFISSLYGSDFKTIPLQTPQHNATLIYKIVPQSQKAVLYIHGFNDYFFNPELAQKFTQQGYSFFAIDLHNYGRNLTSTSLPYYFKNINEFDDELSMAISIIYKDFDISNLTLYGYSQGGLIASLYANSHHNVNQLILDSSFFDFNFNPWIEKLALPLVAYLGQFFPEFKISSSQPNIFGQSLHKDFYGEWDFDITLKSTRTNAPIYLGWIHAVYEAQKKVQKGMNLNIPVLNIYSSASNSESLQKSTLFTSDIVLDVKDIAMYGKNLNQNTDLTTNIVIENAMHGVTLSTPKVRAQAYDAIFNWLNITN